jgi:hypothetical protein
MNAKLSEARKALRLARAQFRLGGHPGSWDRILKAMAQIREAKQEA